VVGKELLEGEKLVQRHCKFVLRKEEFDKKHRQLSVVEEEETGSHITALVGGGGGDDSIHFQIKVQKRRVAKQEGVRYRKSRVIDSQKNY